MFVNYSCDNVVSGPLFPHGHLLEGLPKNSHQNRFQNTRACAPACLSGNVNVEDLGKEKCRGSKSWELKIGSCKE